MKSKYFTLFKIVFFSFLFHVSIVSSEQAQLTVGMELANPPFEMVDTKGNPSGISVDIANQFGQWSGKEIKILNIPFIGLIPSLKSKKIDLIISSMTPTKEREKSIAFSKPYLSIGLCLLINKSSKADSAEALNDPNYKIVVRTGTTGQQYAKDLFPRANVLSLEQESSCITEVLQGKADAFLYDQLSVYAKWQKYKDKLKVNLTPLARDFWAVGIRKDDTLLQEQINSFLLEFSKNGGFEKLSQKYLKEQQEAFKAMNVPLIFSPDDKGGS